MVEILLGLTGSLLLATGALAGLWLGERRRSDILIRVLEHQTLDEKPRKPARVAETPDAEQVAYRTVTERGIERIQDAIRTELKDQGRSASDAEIRAEAERLATGNERFGSAVWP